MMKREDFLELCNQGSITKDDKEYELWNIDKAWETVDMLQDELDALRMRYLSQVSLYKSLYEKEKAKNDPNALGVGDFVLVVDGPYKNHFGYIKSIRIEGTEKLYSLTDSEDGRLYKTNQLKKYVQKYY